MIWTRLQGCVSIARINGDVVPVDGGRVGDALG
jgi:hypothetical protein